MEPNDAFSAFERKMLEAGASQPAIQAFRNSYQQLRRGDTGFIPESSILPADQLPALDQLDAGEDHSLLAQCVIVKLNGGLGTSMGLEGPKSLLKIKEDLNFLDLIALQILHLRKQTGQPLRFLLMNSFSTRDQTRQFLLKYPQLGSPAELDFMQSSVPKVDAESLLPIDWPQNRAMEWCPPGHGDIYPSLAASGWLDQLLDQGVRYMFVSNSDNLGATLDLKLLTYFAQSKQAFLMEVARRTPSDRKGGHLARSQSGQWLLREAAQCQEEDLEDFQNIQRHPFFNTNTLWLKLEDLKAATQDNNGVLPLPLIKNTKTVDPRNSQSPKVFQLETAMGAALQCFDSAGAIVVPRSRFAPVKTTADLLAVRSDAYELTADWRILLAEERAGRPPTVSLDGNHYKLIDQLETLVPVVPSLRACQQLQVTGPVRFSKPLRIEGEVRLHNPGSSPADAPSGTFKDQSLDISA